MDSITIQLGKTAKGEFSTQTGTLSKDSRAYFFRGYFNVDNASAVRGIHLNFGYRDAVIVYINGQQLTALNVPDEGYRTNAVVMEVIRITWVMVVNRQILMPRQLTYISEISRICYRMDRM